MAARRDAAYLRARRSAFDPAPAAAAAAAGGTAPGDMPDGADSSSPPPPADGPAGPRSSWPSQAEAESLRLDRKLTAWAFLAHTASQLAPLLTWADLPVRLACSRRLCALHARRPAVVSL